MNTSHANSLIKLQVFICILTALVLCVPEQAQSPDILLLAAGLRTLLYTSMPPAPGVAAHANMTLKQLRRHIILTVKYNHRVILYVLGRLACWSA